MSIIHAILLGIIQGLTEFLPISSSGHLVIFQRLMQFDKSFEILFDVTVHVGTLGAVVIYYYRDLYNVFGATLSRVFRPAQWKEAYKADVHFRIGIFLLISTFATGVIGLLIKDYVEMFLDVPRYVGIALFFTGLILLIAEFSKQKGKALEAFTLRDAFVIGCIQAIALTPGISRSGITISCAIILGFSRLESARYSFLLAVPAIIAGFVFEFTESISNGFDPSWITPLCVGWISALISGILAIKLILLVLKENRLHWFAFYCWIVGIIVFFFLDGFVRLLHT